MKGAWQVGGFQRIEGKRSEMEAGIHDEERTKRLLAMGQMAASLAHEIRNPLGSMQLFCTLLKKDLSEEPKLFQLADQIHQGIERLNSVISNCLQFARDAKPRKQTIRDIPAFLQDAASPVAPQIERLGIEFEMEHSGDSQALADPFLLSQALANLVANAVDAVAEKLEQSPEEQSSSYVKVLSELKQGEVWRIQIKDTGLGIEEKEQGAVFDPFFTTKDRGTGLGLSIVHTIVKAHGGSIAFESMRGQGTCFTIEFPQDIAKESKE